MRAVLTTIGLVWVIVLAGLPIQAESVYHRDLSILLGDSLEQPIRFSDADLFPVSWYDSIALHLQGSAVEDAMLVENDISDWQLVSLRVAPCMPLGLTPQQAVDDLCWPELRLVWQPVVTIGSPPRRFADDRAIHALYDVAGMLSPKDEQYVASLKQQIKAAFLRGGSPTLPSEDLEAFRALRNETVRMLISRLQQLRGFSFERYQNFGLRPEIGTRFESQFRQSLLDFLTPSVQPESAKEVTTMSLPAGRNPARINRWVFASFVLDNAGLRPRDIPIRSFRTGEIIFSFTSFESVTRQREDLRLDPASLNAAERTDLAQSVILMPPDRRRLQAPLADREQILVPNTSCASCHRLNDNPNNFHNLSMFLDPSELTISPRVRLDVAWDLRWLQSTL